MLFICIFIFSSLPHKEETLHLFSDINMSFEVTVYKSNPRKKLITPLTTEEELFIAIQNGPDRAVQDLIDRGARLDSRWEGWSPLTFACAQGKCGTVGIISQQLLVNVCSAV